MHYVVIGYDGLDEGAGDRRQSARAAHLELGTKLRLAGKHIYGLALLDEVQKMVGSILVVDYNSREELDQWLAEEPYVVGAVWEKVEIHPCFVGPSYLKVPNKSA